MGASFSFEFTPDTTDSAITDHAATDPVTTVTVTTDPVTTDSVNTATTTTTTTTTVSDVKDCSVLDEFKPNDIDLLSESVKNIDIKKGIVYCLLRCKLQSDSFTPELIIEAYNTGKALNITIITTSEIINSYSYLDNNNIIKLVNITGIVPYDEKYKNIVTKINNANLITFNKAFRFQYGIKCEKDEKKAFELYKQDWEENKNSHSLNNLAYCYRDGIGCKKNEKQAFELYTQDWKENKNYRSLYMLSCCYRDGIGCKRDEKKASELYKLNWEVRKDSDSLVYAEWIRNPRM